MTIQQASLHIERTTAGIAQRCQTLRAAGATLGLVPTMGALHDGHLALIRRARQQCDAVVVSIFVNPLQFGPTEDFSKYPRTWDADLSKLQQEGVDVLFAPSAEQMYPSSLAIAVDPGPLGERLDGASRPGHFRGVATVVAKLFHLCAPHVAYFGQKDAAQVAVLRAMVAALNFPLRLIVCPIVREPDGLAMSSRNRYLSAEQRRHALQLSRALQVAVDCFAAGERRVRVLLETMLHEIAREPAIRLDYAEIVAPDTLLPLAALDSEALLAIAAWVGQTRLIDNVLLSSPGAL